jgi:preprotein translocase subunit SecA
MKKTFVIASHLKQVEKSLMLQMLDHHWKEHLAAMDQLRQVIHLRGYAQKNPTQEFKRESFDLFTRMLDSLKYELISTLSKIELVEQDASLAFEQPFKTTTLNFQHAEANTFPSNNQMEETPAATAVLEEPFVRTEPKVGRNDPCPCQSGKKYKQCHGSLGAVD